MNGVIRYLARDALAESLKQAIAKNEPGMWVRAADFDERQFQGKQREVALQDRLTVVEQRNDELLGLLRRIGFLRGTLDQHGLLEEVDAALNPNPDAELVDRLVITSGVHDSQGESSFSRVIVTGGNTRICAKGSELSKSIRAALSQKKTEAESHLCGTCHGEGSISTGIEEASSTICNKCDGTGREQP